MKKIEFLVRIPVLLATCFLIGSLVGCEEAPTPMPKEAAPITKDASGKDLPKGAMPAESPF